VLAVHDTSSGRWGALGISRRSNLMDKPLAAPSLADLVADYVAAYQVRGGGKGAGREGGREAGRQGGREGGTEGGTVSCRHKAVWKTFAGTCLHHSCTIPTMLQARCVHMEDRTTQEHGRQQAMRHQLVFQLTPAKWRYREQTQPVSPFPKPLLRPHCTMYTCLGCPCLLCSPLLPRCAPGVVAPAGQGAGGAPRGA
jgi:hypothetical protein